MARNSKLPAERESDRAEQPSVRIIGGRFRGRKLAYSGDTRTRPMKDRVREALFNLIGPPVKGMHAIDLFAGTGALGLEALSRGAVGATLIEQHFPTADVIQKNIDTLGAADLCEVVVADTLRWVKRKPALPPRAWLVMCSPPFSLYETRLEEMLNLVRCFVETAPAGSVLVVEAPVTFDCQQLAEPQNWDMRTYAPVQLALLRREAAPQP